MKPKTAEGREKDNSASTQNASDMRAEMDLLRQRLRALEASLPGAAPNPPPGRKVESRTAANAVVLLTSVAVLVTHGEEDGGIPIALGEALHRDLPNSQGLVRVPGAAHAANLTHPHVVNPPLLAFLEQHAR